MKLLAISCALLLTTVATWAAAGEIYRCGPAGAEFSQAPCANGARIEVSDSRTADQYSQAVVLAAKFEAWGSAMERDRLATEASYRPTLAVSLNSSASGTTEYRPRSASQPKRKRVKAVSAGVPLLSLGRPRFDQDPGADFSRR